MKFSIIICGHNEAKHLDSCITACLALEYPKNSYEVIYVDNNSTDGSIEVAKKYPIQVFTEARQGPSEARNKGIAEAKGEILIFLDADAVPNKEYLSVCEKVFDDSKIGAATGRVIPNEKTWVSDYLAVSLFEGYPSFKHRKLMRGCSSCNLSVRRSVIEKVGKFMEKLSSSSGITRFGEDKELCERILKGGYKIIYEPDMYIFHDTTYTFGRLYNVWAKGARGRAEMILLGGKDPFSLLFGYNIPLSILVLIVVILAFNIKFGAIFFCVALLTSVYLSLKSFIQSGRFVQCFFIKPWMDVLAALVINFAVLKYRLLKKY